MTPPVPIRVGSRWQEPARHKGGGRVWVVTVADGPVIELEQELIRPLVIDRLRRRIRRGNLYTRFVCLDAHLDAALLEDGRLPLPDALQ